MKFEPETVKGFQDFLPPESLKRKAVREIIEKWFKLYGFVIVETPVVEFEELMRSNILPSEEEAVSERFKLKDRGGRNLGLRYEFTFQLARIFKQNPNIKLPLKRYQIGEVFRDEPVSQLRFRQFTQCDADIVGDSSINADAECLAMLSDILKELKINAEIQLNNKKLLSAIIESVEIQNVISVMKELDKIEKIGEDDVKTNLKKYASTNQIVTLFKLLDKDLSFFKNNAFVGVGELEGLIEKCEEYGIKTKVNLLLARGLAYYTGNVFEVKGPEKISIAAGGRYDKTVGKFLSKEIPAVGISFGLERIANLSNVESEKIPKAVLISINQNKETIKLAKKLRKENISCSVSYEKAGKALEYANSLKVSYVIFIGAEEIEKNKFKLKNMGTGEESLLSEKQLLRILKK